MEETIPEALEDYKPRKTLDIGGSDLSTDDCIEGYAKFEFNQEDSPSLEEVIDTKR